MRLDGLTGRWQNLWPLGGVVDALDGHGCQPVQSHETRYTRLGEVNIAYQVVGEGPDLIVVPMFGSHLDLMWSEPLMERFALHMANYFRLILFDMPGSGVSDRVSRVLTLDARVDVISAVLDAARSRRAAICGTSEGGQASILFAAMHPERTSALILYSAYPTIRPSEHQLAEMVAEMGEDATPERLEDYARRIDALVGTVDQMVEHWGEGRSIDLVVRPPHSRLLRSFWAVAERAAMSRTAARAAFEALCEFDVTEVLPTIRVPTLVMHPTYDMTTPLEAGLYLARKIPGAKFVETHGAHHGLFLGDAPIVAAEIEQFLTGASHEWDPDRAFAAVLFTDIVASTEHAAELGDQRWRELLERHNALVQEQVDSAGGQVVKATGDGFLISFERSADAIGCAEAICTAAERLGIQVRAGVHAGECELLRDDLAGLAVHIGARVGALAQPGEVLVSSVVRDLVAQSGIEFSDRGAHRLKGVPGEWRLFAVRANGAQRDGTRLVAGPRDRVTRRDRIAVGLATRAPGLPRIAARLIRWRPGARRSNVRVAGAG